MLASKSFNRKTAAKRAGSSERAEKQYISARNAADEALDKLRLAITAEIEAKYNLNVVRSQLDLPLK